MNSQVATSLLPRFQKTLSKIGVRSGEKLFEKVIAKYEEEHRHYHNTSHLLSCLGWFDKFTELADTQHVVELALWFHDVIYDPKKNDNEEQSALFTQTELLALGASANEVSTFTQYIRATKAHVGSQGDEALVIDIDLSILGAPTNVFAEFEEQIREEYRHIPTPRFSSGRLAILENFLNRPVLYHHERIRNELEAQARNNLQQRIDVLRASAVL